MKPEALPQLEDTEKPEAPAQNPGRERRDSERVEVVFRMKAEPVAKR